MNLFASHYPLYLNIFLLVIGLYGILSKGNLIKQLIGLNILQAAVILFFILFSFKQGGTIPIWETGQSLNATDYINPLPHALMLTAIVVSVATTGLALLLIRRIHKHFGSLEEKEILQQEPPC